MLTDESRYMNALCYILILQLSVSVKNKTFLSDFYYQKTHFKIILTYLLYLNKKLQRQIWPSKLK